MIVVGINKERERVIMFLGCKSQMKSFMVFRKYLELQKEKCGC